MLPVAPATVNVFTAGTDVSLIVIPLLLSKINPPDIVVSPTIVVTPDAASTVKFVTPTAKSVPSNVILESLVSLPVPPTPKTMPVSLISPTAASARVDNPLTSKVPAIVVLPVSGATSKNSFAPVLTFIPPSKLLTPSTCNVPSVSTLPVPSATVNLVPSTAMPKFAFSNPLSVVVLPTVSVVPTLNA